MKKKHVADCVQQVYQQKFHIINQNTKYIMLYRVKETLHLNMIWSHYFISRL